MMRENLHSVLLCRQEIGSTAGRSPECPMPFMVCGIQGFFPAFRSAGSAGAVLQKTDTTFGRMTGGGRFLIMII